MTLTMRQAKAVVEGWHAGLDVGFGGWDHRISIFGSKFLRIGDGSSIEVDRLYIDENVLWADGPEALLGFKIEEEDERCPCPCATGAGASSSRRTAPRSGAGAIRARARGPA